MGDRRRLAKDTQTNTTLTAQWSAPRRLCSSADSFYEFGGNLSNAPDPTVTIHVIGVKFQDENGNDPNGESIGVSTTTRDRQRIFHGRRYSRASEVGQCDAGKFPPEAKTCILLMSPRAAE